MKNYEIVRLSNGVNEHIIVHSTSFVSPYKQLNEIEQDLANFTNEPVVVIFDMLLCFGASNARYVSAEFDGAKFVEGTFKSLELKMDDVIREYSSAYYNRNRKMVENSILNTNQKRRLYAGKIL